MTNPFEASWRDFTEENPAPELRAAPDPSEEPQEWDPSLWERFKVNMQESWGQTLSGSAAASRDTSERERQRMQEIRFERMRGFDDPVEMTAALAGQIAGQLTSPESYIGAGAGPILGVPVREAVRSIGTIVGTNVGANIAADVGVQATRMDTGLQESYSPQQTVASAVLGATIPVGLTIGGEVASRQIGRLMNRRRMADLVDSPDLEPPTEWVRAEPDEVPEGNVRVVDDLGTPDITVRPAADAAGDATPVRTTPVEPDDAPMGEISGSANIRPTDEWTAPAWYVAPDAQRAPLERPDRVQPDEAVPAEPEQVSPVAPDAEAVQPIEDPTGRFRREVLERRRELETDPETQRVREWRERMQELAARRRELDAEIAEIQRTPEARRASQVADELIAVDEDLERIPEGRPGREDLRAYSIELRRELNTIDDGSDRVAELSGEIIEIEDRMADLQSDPDIAPSPETRRRIRDMERRVRYAETRLREAERGAGARPRQQAAEMPRPVRPITQQAPRDPGPYMVPARALNIDAERFQFKQAINTQGETGILSNVQRWDPDAAGQTIIWQDRQGRMFVADGHQRVNLAQRLMAEGKEDDIHLTGRLYREEDGVSAENARVIAAVKNIREGSGSLRDAATVLRDAPEQAAEIRQMGGAKQRDAAGLANLQGDAWGMFLNEIVPEQQAAIVGRVIPDDVERQVAAMEAIAQMEPRNLGEADLLVRRVAQTDLTDRAEGGQGSLFGDDAQQSTAMAEIRILNRAVNELMRDKRTMQKVDRNADLIAETGSQLERDNIRRAATDAERTAVYLRSLADQRGPVRDALVDEAGKLARGTTSLSDSTRRFVQNAKRAIDGADPGGGQAGGRGGGVEAGDAAPSGGDGGTGQLLRREGGVTGDELARQRTPGGQQRPGNVTGRPQQGVAGQGDADPAARIDEVIQRLGALTDTTQRIGRINVPKALGVYNRVSGVARRRFVRDVTTAAHEIGHSLHVGLGRQTQSEIDGLITRNPDVAAFDPWARARGRSPDMREAFAEFFAVFTLHPGWARRTAPQFTQAFEDWLSSTRPQMARDINEIQKAYYDYQMKSSVGVVRDDIVSPARKGPIERFRRATAPDRDPAGNTLYSLVSRFYTAAVDRLHPIYKAVDGLAQVHERATGKPLEIPADMNPETLARILNAEQMSFADLKHGVIPYRGVDPEGPSYVDAIQTAIGKPWYANWRDDDIQDFGAYLVARRAVEDYDAWARDEIPNPPAAPTKGDFEQVIAELEAMYPNFRDAAEMIYEWQRNALRKYWNAGFINEQQYLDFITRRPSYVPFQRDMSDNAAEAVANANITGKGNLKYNLIKAFRGSDRAILNPVETIPLIHNKRMAALAENEVAKTLDGIAQMVGPGGGAIAERIPAKDLEAVQVDLEEAIRVSGRAAGADEADIQALAGMAVSAFGKDNMALSLYRSKTISEGREPIVFFWEGGKLNALRLADGEFGQALYEAITGMGHEQTGLLLNMLGAASNVVRATVTSHPSYIIGNFVRDQISASILEPGFVPGVTAARGYSDSRMRRMSAAIGNVVGGEATAGMSRQVFDQDVKALKGRTFVAEFAANPMAIFRATEASETATRVGMFKRYFDAEKRRGKGDYEAAVVAAARSRDYLDFGRHGSRTLHVRKIIPFLNVAIQGVDKAGRRFFNDALRPLAKVYNGRPLTDEDRANLGRSAWAWLAVGAAAAVELTVTSIYADDPEWKEWNDYYRATHLPVKIGGQWVGIPKGFETAIPMNLASRAYEAIAMGDPTAWSRFVRSQQYTLLPPHDVPGVQTFTELTANHDYFTGRPIINEWEQGVSPALQYNEYTSELGKFWGDTLGVSPEKVDHAISSFFTLWGRDAMTLSDTVAQAQAGERGEQFDPTRAWVLSRFAKDPVRGGRSRTDFYKAVGRSSGKFTRAAKDYELFQKEPGRGDAEKHLADLEPTHRAYALLMQARDDEEELVFSADARRLHPMRRAGEVNGVISGLRREMAGRRVESVETGEVIEMTGTERQMAQDTLEMLQGYETRNALAMTGVRGWASTEVVDPADFYEDLRMQVPELAAELNARLRDEKVMPHDTVREVWPELQQRLLTDGKDALTLDLEARARAERVGAYN